MNDILTIAENERRFLAHELHDNIIQTLLQVNMQVAICKRYLELGHLTETQAEIDSLEDQIGRASGQIRDLIADLRLPLGDDGSFASTLQKLIDIHQCRQGPPVTLNGAPDIQLAPPVVLALTRIIQEALLNVRKHAQAKTVNLAVAATETNLTISISDDGVGFDDALVPNPLADKGGAGIINMQIRAEALQGAFDIQSQPDQGTTITVTVPR